MRFDKYEVDEEGCYIEIDSPTYGKHKVRFDEEDWDLIKNYHWNIEKGNRTYYAQGKINRKTLIRMHRLVLKMKNPKILIDHINNNGLDNHKTNLRLCTCAQNTINSIPGKNNTSGYKGVHWNKRRKKWVAKIQKKCKTYYLGYYNNPKEGARAYNKFVKKHYGEFAYLNPVEE